ncbi:hypothetical protein [Hymenobacter sp. DG01]|uniref:hypothetical protein n=1 Tax=Hymenobacter sp. DG01 TaxID=2584940 RepID=UPI00111F4831|nr:hypothetical protein [Hymenobacter sp. DG01]
MSNTLQDFIEFVESQSGKLRKAQLANLAQSTFALVKDRSVYYREEFAVRFSTANSSNFSNTVLSLSNLQKYDTRIFLVCLVTPDANFLLIANTTFLKKISHSSQKLRIDNIRGSFNGSDILREFIGTPNIPKHFDELFLIHKNIDFSENLARLVETTNNISPVGSRFHVTPSSQSVILEAPQRAHQFINSEDAITLKSELDEQVARFQTEIMVAALIENVNIRGRVIEYLITGEDETFKQELSSYLNSNKNETLNFRTKNTLGDYTRVFEHFITQTDVKTKIMVLSSNPKGYNLDKILEFLSQEKTVFMFYFVGITTASHVETALISMFQHDLLNATIALKHCAGRASRGVTQFNGEIIKKLIKTPNNFVSQDESIAFLNELIEL